MAVERADVCLIMIDASVGITEQDEKIAGIAHEAGKASIIVVNKWDSIEKDNSTVKAFTDRIRESLAYMPYAPITFVSAKTGQRIDGLYDLIQSVYEQSHFRVTTGALNDVLGEAMMRVQPPTDKGKRLKIYYMTQTQVAPPTFVLFCNSAELFHFSYQRYIENCLRETYGFKGTPIKMVIKQRGDDPEINVRGIPPQISLPTPSRELLEIHTRRNAITTSVATTTNPPTKPNFSHTVEKIKSVCDAGRSS